MFKYAGNDILPRNVILGRKHTACGSDCREKRPLKQRNILRAWKTQSASPRAHSVRCSQFTRQTLPVEIQSSPPSNLLQIGELFHQLFHAVAGKKDGELGVFSVAFAQQDGAFAVLGVADALTFFQAGSAF